jgi:hypothetical protein
LPPLLFFVTVKDIMSVNDGAGTSHTSPKRNGEIPVPPPPPPPFVFEEWIQASKITDAGRKKLALNAIVDYESVLFVTDRDIVNCKLAAGDRAKFERHVYKLKTGASMVEIPVIEISGNANATPLVTPASTQAPLASAVQVPAYSKVRPVSVGTFALVSLPSASKK